MRLAGRGCEVKVVSVLPSVQDNRPLVEETPPADERLRPQDVAPQAYARNGRIEELKKQISGGHELAKQLSAGFDTDRVPSVRVIAPISQPELMSSMRKIGAQVAPWDPSRFTFVKHLEKASRNRGEVVLMKDNVKGRNVAVTQMPFRWVRTGYDDFMAQYPCANDIPWVNVGIMAQLATVGSKYVCEFYGMFRAELDVYVVTSFCSGGDLFSWSDSSELPNPGPERERETKPIVRQMFKAICWLHDLGIAHRDLSLENIMLAGRGRDAEVKIIDFGMSTLARFVRNEVRGKASYQAPEIHAVSLDIDTFLADCFSLGVVLFAMNAHDYPWTCTRRGKCQLFELACKRGFRDLLSKRRTGHGHGEPMIDVFSEELANTLSAMLQVDPNMRACLGESCFVADVASGDRQDACFLGFLPGDD